MKSTLIVGCGFLGQRVGQLLLEDDPSSEVVGTTRSPSGADRLTMAGIHPALADVLQPETLAAVPLPDRIVYCIGFDRAAGVPMRTVYVDGLRNLLDRLATVGWSGRFVYASSTGVYGQTGGSWVDEDSPTQPSHQSGIVCLEAETLLRETSRSRGLKATTIRFAGLYGPGRIVRRAAIERGEPIAGDPERWLNLIHIDDAARAVLAAADSETASPIFLACDDRPVRRREYYDRIARHLGAPEPRFVRPEPGSPEAMREESDKRISNRKIKEELGLAWRYPDIESGIPASLPGS